MGAQSDELLRRIYDAFNAREIDRVLTALHPNVEWPNGMTGGYVHGREAVRTYWTNQWQQIDPHVEPTSIARDGSGRKAIALTTLPASPACLQPGHRQRHCAQARLHGQLKPKKLAAVALGFNHVGNSSQQLGCRREHQSVAMLRACDALGPRRQSRQKGFTTPSQLTGRQSADNGTIVGHVLFYHGRLARCAARSASSIMASADFMVFQRGGWPRIDAGGTGGVDGPEQFVAVTWRADDLYRLGWSHH